MHTTIARTSVFHQNSVRSRISRQLAIGLAILVLLATSQSFAAPLEDFQKRFVLRAGGFHVSKMSTELTFGKTGGAAGTSISFENTLDLPNTVQVGKLSGFYRINRNQRIDFFYYKVDRNSTGVTPITFDIGSANFTAGDTVNTIANSDFISALWSYSFINDEKYEFGLGGGLYLSNKEMIIDNISSGSDTASGTATAGLPVFNFRGDWNITRKWRMGVEQNIFLVDLGTLSGALSNFEWRIEHQTFKHLGFGAALNYFTSSADLSANGIDADIRTSYNGLFIYLKGAI